MPLTPWSNLRGQHESQRRPSARQDAYTITHKNLTEACLDLVSVIQVDRTFLSTSDFSRVKLAKLSAKLVANFRRSLEGDFRASSAGENSQRHFPPKLRHKFHHQTSLRGSGLGPTKTPETSKVSEMFRMFWDYWTEVDPTIPTSFDTHSHLQRIPSLNHNRNSITKCLGVLRFHYFHLDRNACFDSI